MAFDVEFAEQWQQYTNLEFVTEERRKFGKHCTYSKQFSLWAEDLIKDVGETLTITAVQQAKLQLLDKYMAWRNSVPKNHRDRVGNRGGHICIYQVFADAYEVLHMIELSMTPPLFVGPPKPEPKGILIGEVGGG